MTGRLYFIARRLLRAMLLIPAIIVLCFFLIRLAPGDAALVIAGESWVGNEKLIADLREQMGLDRPLWEQLYIYLSGALQLDLGYSFRQQADVLSLILERLPATLVLAGAALVFAVLTGIFLGALAAINVGKWADTVITVLALAIYATPLFWLALMAVLAFAVYFPVFPPFGMTSIGAPSDSIVGHILDVAWHMVLPALTLGLFYVAIFTRLTRAQMLEVAGMDFVRTARAKGISERRVVLRHVLRNALLPVTTYAGFQAGQLISSAVLVETVFSWPGVGRLAYESMLGRDYNTLLGVFITTSIMVIIFNMLTDLLYSFIDPRIELTR